MKIALLTVSPQRYASFTLLLSIALAAPFAARGFGSSQTSKQAGSSRAKHGESLFHEQCTGCHNKQPDDTSPFGPPNLYQVLGRKPLITTLEARTIITRGKGQMPAFGGKLSNSQIDDVLAYLRNPHLSSDQGTGQ
jgi:mono/diheme cytochrome c family protein